MNDVAKRTMLVFLRPGFVLTDRAVAWLSLAHATVRAHYGRGARRDVVGASVGCHGELPLNAWWANVAGPINFTCAFSPVRTGNEDLWRFFTSWLGARRREWKIWPHIWHEEPAVPTFWKGKSKAKRDARLVHVGELVGTDYSYVDRPDVLWEHWYARWAANYSLRIVTAETNMGVVPIRGVASMSAGSAHQSDSLPPLIDSMSASDGNGVAEDGQSTRTTKYGDLVSLGELWYYPVDAEFGEGYFRALQDIVGKSPKLVSLAIVNKKFIQLTQSWLCNVETAGFTPPNIIWIALDQESKHVLDATGVGTTVDITDALSAPNMDPVDILYGQPSYWKLMLMRTRLMRDLLDRGIDVFLFETDQVWLQDPLAYIRKELETGADMVGTLDTQHNVAGNTLMLKSVLSTRRMWSEVYLRFKISYDGNNITEKNRTSVTFVEHDQHCLSDLLLYNTEFTQDFPVALGLLNAQLFVGGSWYTGAYSSLGSRRPVIINNNFVSGTNRKKRRAVAFGHWFLKEEDGSCDVASVEKALRYEFKRPPGSAWDVPHERGRSEANHAIQL